MKHELEQELLQDEEGALKIELKAEHGSISSINLIATSDFITDKKQYINIELEIEDLEDFRDRLNDLLVWLTKTGLKK